MVLDQGSVEVVLSSSIKSQQIAPKQENELTIQAMTRQDLNLWDEVVKAYDRSIAIDTNDVEVYIHHGKALKALKRLT